MQKIRDRLNLLKTKLQSRWQVVPARNRKIILIVVGVFIFLFLLLVILGVLTNMQRRNGQTDMPTPTPAQTTPVEEDIVNPSRYATDAAILKIEGDIEVLDKRMGEEKVRQEDLNLPQLDFEVSF